MSVTMINPYILLDGTAAQAIEHYKSALGATTDTVMRYGDLPDSKPENAERVMHARLRVGPAVFMVADTMPGLGAATQTAVEICIHFDDAADLQKKFDALAVGGKVEHPVHDTFWGGKFGALVDKFGISWMFNYETKKD